MYQRTAMAILMTVFITLLSCQKKEERTLVINQIEAPSQSASGGVIDGGGSGYEYPTEQDIQETLQKALEQISTTEEGMNFSVHLVDQLAIEYNGYEDKLENLTFLQKVLVELVGLPTRIQMRRRKLCERKAERDCDSLYPLKRQGLGTIVNSDNVELKHKCHDLYHRERVGAVSSFSRDARICLSLEQLKKVPTISLHRSILALLFHEASHMLNYKTEKEAEIIENYINSEYEYIKSLMDGLADSVSLERTRNNLALRRIKDHVEVPLKAYKNASNNPGAFQFWEYENIRYDLKYFDISIVEKSLIDAHKKLNDPDTFFRFSLYYDYKNEYLFTQLREKASQKIIDLLEKKSFSQAERKFLTDNKEIHYETEEEVQILDKYYHHAQEIEETFSFYIELISNSISPATTTENEDFIYWLNESPEVLDEIY